MVRSESLFKIVAASKRRSDTDHGNLVIGIPTANCRCVYPLMLELEELKQGDGHTRQV